MDFLDEDSFIAQFQARLKTTRERDLKWTHGQMAHALRIKEDAYKKYENRAGSAFPLFLLPRLIYTTGKAYSYWVPDVARTGRIRVVK